MHFDIGRKVKYFRTKANMTQEELAQGIISVSYLSKIEKEAADPSPKIIDQICRRLNVKPYNTAEAYTYKLCEMWFTSLLHSDLNQAESIYKEIQQWTESIVDAGLIELVDIHMLQYYILTNSDDLADRQINDLKESPSISNHMETYYWLKFSGNYHFFKMSYKQAFDYYREAETFLDGELYNSTMERNDLYYVLSITSSKLQMSYLACVYANRALEYYKSVFHLKRSAQCHILLGISYFQAKEFNKAEDSYEVAYQLATSLNDEITLSLCNQSLGELYSELEDRDKAIYYYSESYRFRLKSHQKSILTPVTSIMAEHYKAGEFKEAKIWLEKAIEVAKHLTPSVSYHVYFVEVYKHLINGYGHSFEDLLVKEVIPFFEEKQLQSLKAEYQSILADFYFHRRKYKLAATYYNEANKTIEKINI